MLLTSIGVSGRGAFAHVDQFLNGDDPTVYIEARDKSELYLILGNPEDRPLTVKIQTSKIDIWDVMGDVTLPFRSCLHARLVLQRRRTGIITLDWGDGSRRIALGSRIELREHMGVDISDLDRPNPFPADGMRGVRRNSFDQNDFDRLVDISPYDLSGSKIYREGRLVNRSREKMGYVYLLRHPDFEGWVKIGSTVDLAKRLSTYQTSDPLRRFELIRHYGVDDRTAFEFWIRNYLSQHHHIQNEWVRCSAQQAIKITEDAITTLKEANNANG